MKLSFILSCLVAIVTVSCSSKGNTLAANATKVYYGSTQGIVYQNDTILPGNAPVDSIDGTAIQNIAHDSTHNLYVITYAGNVFKYQNNLWQLIGGRSLGARNFFHRLAIDANDNIYAIGSDGYIYTTNSTKATWQVFIGLLPNNYTALNIYSNGNTIYASTQYTIYQALSTAQSWTQVSGEEIPGDPSAQISAMAFDNNTGDIYASMLWGNVYVLESGSQNWQIIGSGKPGSGAGYSISLDQNNNIYTTNIDNVDPLNSGNVYVANLNMPSWQQVGQADDKIGAQTIFIESSTIYAGSLAPLYFNHDDDIWFIIAGGNGAFHSIDGSSVVSLLNLDGYLYTGTALGTLGKYSNDFNSFTTLNNQQIASLDGSQISSVSLDSSGNPYAATSKGNVFKYQNNHWQQIGKGTPGTISGAAPVTNYVLIDNNYNAYVTNFDGQVYFAKNSTESWTMLGNTKEAGYANAGISSLALSQNKLYMVSVGLNNNVYVYKNKIWTPITTVRPTTGEHPLLIVNADKHDNIYTSNLETSGFWKTTGDNSSWQLMPALPDQGGVFAINFDSHDNLFIGSVHGHIYKLINNTWAQVGNQLPCGINFIAINKTDNLYALCYSDISQYHIYRLNSTNNLWQNIVTTSSALYNIAAF